MENVYDVAIVGSGPAGLTAAIYTSRANLKTLVLAGTKWGGQLMLTTTVENFPGFPDGVEGPQLMENMKQQAEKFGTKLVHENVLSCHSGGRRPIESSNKKDPIASLQGDNVFEVKTETAGYLSKAVIIATGAETKWLGLENEQRLIGHGVSSCAPCDAFFFKNKKVAVVGGGDSACEEALFLTKFASEVTIIHRRDQLRASKIMQDRVKANPKIKMLYNSKVMEIIGKDKLESLKIETFNENCKLKIENLEVDGLFVAIGHSPNNELLKGLEGQSGIFIAGDVIDTKYKQAITAAASGCQAAMDCEVWLSSLGHPGSRQRRLIGSS